MQETNGQVDFAQLSERIISDHIGFVLPKHSFIFKAFNRKLNQLVEGGLIEKLTKSKVQIKPEESEPTQLSLDHLEIWFQTCFVLLCFAIFSFIIELVWKKLSEKFNLNCKAWKNFKKSFLLICACCNGNVKSKILTVDKSENLQRKVSNF